EANVVNVIGNAELRKQYPNVAATIDGKPIWLESVVEMCLKLYGKQDLESMISIRLIQQECKKVDLKVTDQDVATDVWINAAQTTQPLQDGSPNVKAYLRSELAKYQTSEENYRRSIVWPSVALRKLSEGNVKVTDEDIQKRFEAKFGASVQCLGIVVSDERRARDVWQKARTEISQNPENAEKTFGDLAAEYSVEPDSKQTRGLIAPICKHGGFPQLEEEAFSLQPGELSQVIQIDAQTFVILFCKEQVPAREVTLEEARETIVSDLRKIKEVMAAGDFYADVFRRASIVNNLTGASQFPQSRVATPAVDTTLR
ncbi:MAG: peptidylprolyl isomerase, partial [Thermoguttaceae bacterium]|nr:peptidylprolyl isomerase [Thermoguttaceae bacterium]